jgi:hypothetical protein
MTGHVLVVASGFGKRVIPARGPYRFALDTAGALVLTNAEERQLIVAVDVTSPHGDPDIADIVSGPSWPEWWLETSLYRIPLPGGWTAMASGDVNPVAFDLVGPNDSLIFVQTPQRTPPIDEMIAPGQTRLARRSSARAEFITLGYTHDRRHFVQCHAVTHLGSRSVIVTLQCDRRDFSTVTPVHEFLAESLRPGGS